MLKGDHFSGKIPINTVFKTDSSLLMPPYPTSKTNSDKNLQFPYCFGWVLTLFSFFVRLVYDIYLFFYVMYKAYLVVHIECRKKQTTTIAKFAPQKPLHVASAHWFCAKWHKLAKAKISQRQKKTDFNKKKTITTIIIKWHVLINANCVQVSQLFRRCRLQVLYGSNWIVFFFLSCVFWGVYERVSLDYF